MQFDNNIAIDHQRVMDFMCGNEKGFTHFFQLYYPALCFFAARVTADNEAAKDITSNAFIKTWKKHERLHSASDIKAYLYQVVRNDCYKWLQQQKKEKILQQNLAIYTATAAESYLALVIQSEVIAMLHQHIQQMPAGRQKIFAKLYVEGKSIAEAAAELQLSPSTVKTQKQRGLQALRALPGIDGLANG
jgi:RNA polymerase sigma-70 factor (family 1)